MDLFNEKCTRRKTLRKLPGRKRATVRQFSEPQRKRRRTVEPDEERSKRGAGRPVGSKTRHFDKVHRRELQVQDWSDTDSMVSFNTRSMVRRKNELIETGQLDSNQLLRATAHEPEYVDQTPSNLNSQFEAAQESSSSEDSPHSKTTPFR